MNKRGNKKENIKFSFPMNKKKAQVTFFIIIALLIIVSGVIIYLFYPDLTGSKYSKSENPQEFLKGCIENKNIQDIINKISIQGGSIDPELNIEYYGNNVEYLCYINEYYLPCVVQRPMLKDHVEQEIYNAIKPQMQECEKELEDSFRKKGYSVHVDNKGEEVHLLPGKIQLKFNNNLKLEKAGETKNYDSVEVSIKSALYDLVIIATNIIRWETNYGDAETTTYMTYYRDLKVEKNKLSDGTTIYKLTNRNTGEKFQFASRSVAWPPGYGFTK